ncbi:L,D-transpeptidase [Nocardioides montaniterrae]
MNSWTKRATGVVAVGLLLASAGCDATKLVSGSSDAAPTPQVTPHHQHAPKPKPKPTPTGPPMLLDSIAPLSGQKVGVAMPISIVFTDPVATSARKGVEQAISIKTSQPIDGAWHWFGPQRADFRPKRFWPSGTHVQMVADFAHVPDGNGRYGTHSYTRDFTIGSDVRTRVYVKQHKATVTINGKLARTMPIDAGSPEFPSWDGTMAVVNKERTTEMKSCSVGIACDKNDPNFYDIVLPWDVRITNSGTFLHYSTGDPYPGHSYGSHGCVHLSWDDSKWFYNLAKTGDPVTIQGSPRGKAEGDNGYADYNLGWSDWLAGSGRGAFTTST